MDRDEFAEGWGRGWSPTNAGLTSASTGFADDRHPPGTTFEGNTGWPRSWNTLRETGINRAKEPYGWPRRAERPPFARQHSQYWSNSNVSGSSTRNHVLPLAPEGVLFATQGADSTGNISSVTCTGYTFTNAFVNLTLPDSGQGRCALWVGLRDTSVAIVGQTVAITATGAWRAQQVLEVWGIRGEIVEFFDYSPGGAIGSVSPTGVRSIRADEVFLGCRHQHSGGNGPNAVSLPYRPWGTAAEYTVDSAGSGTGLIATAFSRPMENGGLAQPTYSVDVARDAEIYNTIWR